MLKFFRTIVIFGVLLQWNLSGGVAAADPPNLEDVTDFKDTPDGLWRLHVSLHHMNITSVPNMAATAFTREALVSATAEVWVQALHPDEETPNGADVTQRSISLWIEQGCQATIGVSTVGGSDTSQNNLSDTSTTGTSTNNNFTPTVGQQPNESIQQQLTPGKIDRKILDDKAYPDLKVEPHALNNDVLSGLKNPKPPEWVGPGWSNDKVIVAVRNWDMKVDACAGPVSFRFQAGATMRTPHFETNVDAFSAIVQG